MNEEPTGVMREALRASRFFLVPIKIYTKKLHGIRKSIELTGIYSDYYENDIL